VYSVYLMRVLTQIYQMRMVDLLLSLLQGMTLYAMCANDFRENASIANICGVVC
jgi:hypothetical protein